MLRPIRECGRGLVVGYLRGGVEGGRFLGQIIEIKLQLGKIVMKRAVVLILGGQSHTRMEIVFLHLGLFEEVKKIAGLVAWRGL